MVLEELRDREAVLADAVHAHVQGLDALQDEESYVHRIGRTGRAGRQGIAFTFVTAKEIYKSYNFV